jgi:glycolate oxidase FAD binding subunit
MTAAVAPGSIEEAAFVVREAAARGAHVMPVGGGTKLWWRGDPLDPGGRETVRLETGGLNRVVELSPGDMTVTVEAGMTLAALDALLEPHRLWWPVDADTHDGKATIGGVLASDSGGPMRMSLGGPREHVLGVSIVIGDGALVSAGGRVVKNVAGYDLHRLMVGSWGALGLIAAASLKLRPRPECVRSVVINAATLPEAIRTCDELLDGPLSPVGVTLRWPGMHVSSASSAEGGWRFAVAACFAGDEGFAAAQVEASRRALGGAVEMTPFGDACQPLSAEWRDPRTDRTRVEAWV